MITVYGRNTPPCSYCEAAKVLLEQRGLYYKYIEIGKDITRDEVISKFPGHKTVPIIVVDNKTLDNGYTSLKEIIDDISGGYGDDMS